MGASPGVASRESHNENPGRVGTFRLTDVLVVFLREENVSRAGLYLGEYVSPNPDFV